MHQLPNGIRPSSIPLLAPILLALLSTAEGGVTDVQGLSTVSYVNDAASLERMIPSAPTRDTPTPSTPDWRGAAR